MTENAVVATERQLVARSPMELESAHTALIEWCNQRIVEQTQVAQEEQESLRIATERKWRLRGIKARIRRAEALVLFYGKVKKAIEAGYYLVPNFPMDVFAIRTKRTTPRGSRHVSRGRYPSIARFQQNAERLPAGEGEYHAPEPKVETESYKDEDEKGELEKVIESWPKEFQPPDFPFELATPAVMTQTGEAMALKLFDEVGIARDEWQRRGDPMILGHLVDPRPSRQGITFFIAWALDLERL